MDIPTLNSGCFVPPCKQTNTTTPIFQGSIYCGTNDYQLTIQRHGKYIIESTINWPHNIYDDKEMASMTTTILRKISILAFLATGYPFNFRHYTFDNDSRDISYEFEKSQSNTIIIPYSGDNILKQRLSAWIPRFNDKNKNDDYEIYKETIFNIMVSDFARSHLLTFLAHYLFLVKEENKHLTNPSNKMSPWQIPISCKYKNDYFGLKDAFSRIRNCTVHPEAMKHPCPMFLDYGIISDLHDCLYDGSEFRKPWQIELACKERDKCLQYVFYPAKRVIVNTEPDTHFPSVILLNKIKCVTRAYILHNYFKLWEQDDTGLHKEFEHTLFSDIKSL